MCTSVVYRNNKTYFGRNLDYEVSYHPSIVITPRKFPFKFTNGLVLQNHNAIVGVALVENNFPLYYDAINDKGLAMAGLNFVNNAHYFDPKNDMLNIASFEFIPFVLSQCSSIEDVKKLLVNAQITNQLASPNLPASELHWQLADKNKTIVIESTKTGLHIYDNPIEVLTNNPPFEFQVKNLDNYRHLSNEDTKNFFAPQINLDAYSRGMGTIGLPGGVDSESRFVRCAFTKFNSVSGNSEEENVSQFFHILTNVQQVKGETKLAPNSYEYTLYTSCGNIEDGIFYYNTYNNHQITKVDLNKVDLDTELLISYKMIEEESFNLAN